jgi:hypothetical protein
MLIQALLAALGLVALLLARYSWITRRRRPFDAQKRPVKALIVLGSGAWIHQNHLHPQAPPSRTRAPSPRAPSPAHAPAGGHTAEMLKLLDSIDKSKYSRRCYVVAATDKMSGGKAVAKEQSWQTSPKVGALGPRPPSAWRQLALAQSIRCSDPIASPACACGGGARAQGT